VYDLATKIYTQSGYRVELAIIRDIVNSRTEDLSYKLVAEQKRIKQKWAEEEARHRIEEEKKAKDAYRIEQERIAEETRLYANQKQKIEEARCIVTKEYLVGKFGGNQSKAEVFVRVRKILSEQLDIEEIDINLDCHLSNHLGADEYDLVEIILALEEEFDIKISDEESDCDLGTNYYQGWMGSTTSGFGLSGWGGSSAYTSGATFCAGYNCIVRNFVELIHSKTNH
jgi:acyl carrier protein